VTPKLCFSRNSMLKFSVFAFAQMRILAHVLCLMLVLCTRPACADETVSVVTQSNQYVGPTKLYMAQDKFKLIARKGDLFVLCAPPLWKVIVYRKDDNTAAERPLETWEHDGLHLLPGNPRGSVATSVTDFDTELNTMCTTTTLNVNRPFYNANDPLVFRTTSKANIRKLVMKTTATIPLSQKAKQFLRGIYSDVNLQNFPLELVQVVSDGRADTIYTTSKFSKEKVPSGFWAYPTNYKIVAKLQNLLTTGKDIEQYGSLLKNIMLDDQEIEKSGKPGKNTSSRGK